MNSNNEVNRIDSVNDKNLSKYTKLTNMELLVIGRGTNIKDILDLFIINQRYQDYKKLIILN